MKVIDYSQMSLWSNCPWAWYERYVKGMSPRYVGQRDDALALGSLVHNGLDEYSKTGRGAISQETIAEIGPTPECLRIAEMMVAGYIQKYPVERWPVERTEEAVQFPLGDWGWGNNKEWFGIAKLDGYFYVPEDTQVESGQPGQTLTLGKGWWSREYKTKSPSVNRGTWMMEWAAKRQADFQLLALTDLLENYPPWAPSPGRGKIDTVRGVLVSVLEKPREYTPRRKCKGCSDTYDLESFIPTPEGHKCPACGTVQHMKPYVPTVVPMPDYWRMIVTRTPDQLEVARREILCVAGDMQDMMNSGMESVVPNRDNCISNRWHRKCEYAEQHIAGKAVAAPEFVQVDPYRYIGAVL